MRHPQLSLLLEGRLLHIVEIAEIASQVGIALALDAALVGTAAVGGALAVAAVELVDDVHAGGDLTERRKAHLVEPAVVGEVDEDLRGARVRPRGREGDEAALVALLDRIV